jgi:hypothetical protein
VLVPFQAHRAEALANIPDRRQSPLDFVAWASTGVCAFYRGTTQRNLYRIPVH